jgi:hypothetical protein
MSESQYKDLVEELAGLVLKQQLNILSVNERVYLRSRLKEYLINRGHHKAAELAVTLKRTPEQTEYLVEIINKEFKCLS